MIDNIDIEPNELSLVQEILRAHLNQDIIIWIFGSRITHKAKKFSDLDIMLEDKSGKKISNKIITSLKYAFEQSILPWKVDIVDNYDLEETFRVVIDKQKVLLQLGKSNSS